MAFASPAFFFDETRFVLSKHIHPFNAEFEQQTKFPAHSVLFFKKTF